MIYGKNQLAIRGKSLFCNRSPGQFAGIVWPVAVLGHEVNETRIEHVPFAERGRCFGHMAQPLEFLIGPGATLGDLLVFSFRESFGVADQMGQGLIFPEHISDSFEAKYAALMAEAPSCAEDPDEYLAENIFWVPKEARWSPLQGQCQAAEDRQARG